MIETGEIIFHSIFCLAASSDGGISRWMSWFYCTSNVPYKLVFEQWKRNISLLLRLPLLM